MSKPSARDNDIVVDTNVMRLYDAPSDPKYKELFVWLDHSGVLAISQKLLAEYIGTGNRLIAPFIDNLLRNDRLNRVQTSELKSFDLDRHYPYSCNKKDIWHARLVFLSKRKILVSLDDPLISDVNGFRKVTGVKPTAHRYPPTSCLSAPE